MSNFRLCKQKNKGKFYRAKLPFPVVVMFKLKISTGIPNAAGYWKINYLLHKSGADKNPSLNIHQVNGNFRWHACGTKCGDNLSFFMLLTGTKFVEAVKHFGECENE